MKFPLKSLRMWEASGIYWLIVSICIACDGVGQAPPLAILQTSLSYSMAHDVVYITHTPNSRDGDSSGNVSLSFF